MSDYSDNYTFDVDDIPMRSPSSRSPSSRSLTNVGLKTYERPRYTSIPSSYQDMPRSSSYRADMSQPSSSDMPRSSSYRTDMSRPSSYHTDMTDNLDLPPVRSYSNRNMNGNINNYRRDATTITSPSTVVDTRSPQDRNLSSYSSPPMRSSNPLFTSDSVPSRQSMRSPSRYTEVPPQPVSMSPSVRIPLSRRPASTTILSSPADDYVKVKRDEPGSCSMNSKSYFVPKRDLMPVDGSSNIRRPGTPWNAMKVNATKFISPDRNNSYNPQKYRQTEEPLSPRGGDSYRTKYTLTTADEEEEF